MGGRHFVSNWSFTQTSPWNQVWSPFLSDFDSFWSKGCLEVNKIPKIDEGWLILSFFLCIIVIIWEYRLFWGRQGKEKTDKLILNFNFRVASWFKSNVRVKPPSQYKVEGGGAEGQMPPSPPWFLQLCIQFRVGEFFANCLKGFGSSRSFDEERQGRLGRTEKGEGGPNI